MLAVVDRAFFLHTLECVAPGLSANEVVSQSGSFVFQSGVVLTYNEEVACRTKSGLPPDFTGAVKAKAFIELLRKMDSEKVKLSVEPGTLVVLGSQRDRARMRMDAEITIPLADLEKPRKDDWRPVHEEFNDAVNIVQAVAGNDPSQFVGMCLHLTPKWIEATDGFQLARYRLDTGLTENVLVKRDALKHVVPLDVTKVCQTPKWLHFRNPAGVTLSVLRHLDPYPDLKKNLRVEGGTPTALPKSLAQAVQVASIFSKENADANQLVVNLKPGKEKNLMVTGIGTSGEYSKVFDVLYGGQGMAFTIPPEILQHVATKHSECVLTPTRLKVEGGKWDYVTSLGSPDNIITQPKKETHGKETEETRPPEEEAEETE